MIEVEVKYRVESPVKVRERVRDSGGKLLGMEREEDIYFNHPCKDYSMSDEAVRLRIHGDGSATLTYKGPRIGAVGKAREEASVHVDDPVQVLELLNKLGFKEVARVTKNREVYSLDNFTLYLDEVQGLGYFAEIETLVDSNEMISKAIENIMELGKKLGLNEESIVNKTYLELLIRGY